MLLLVRSSGCSCLCTVVRLNIEQKAVDTCLYRINRSLDVTCTHGPIRGCHKVIKPYQHTTNPHFFFIFWTPGDAVCLLELFFLLFYPILPHNTLFLFFYLSFLTSLSNPNGTAQSSLVHQPSSSFLSPSLSPISLDTIQSPFIVIPLIPLPHVHKPTSPTFKNTLNQRRPLYSVPASLSLSSSIKFLFLLDFFIFFALSGAWPEAYKGGRQRNKMTGYSQLNTQYQTI